MPVFIWVILACLLSFILGWIVRGAGIKGVIGNLNVVHFPNDTVELLLQVDKDPKDFLNGQYVTLQVFAMNSTRK